MAALLLVLVLAGCATGAQSWPAVVDGHIVISALVVCWLALCVVWLIRGLTITLKQVKSDED